MKNQNSLTKAFQYINKKTYNSKKINMNETILIVGTPRSGTTWLMEILATLPNYTYTFEPLNPIWNPSSFLVGFRSRTYLQKETIWPEGEEYLRKIFTGQIAEIPVKGSLIVSLLHGFSIKNTMSQFLGKKLIVKSVNMNQMLPWIAEKFQLRRIFFIIRHPCAVIASQLKTGLCGYRPTHPPYKDIFPTQKDILDEASKIKNLNSEIYNMLKKIKTREEILAASWCLDNFIPFFQETPHPWSTVIYEKLVKDGKKEIIKLFNEIQEQKTPKKAFKVLKKPSMVILREEKKIINKPIEQLSKWKKTLSEKQVENILNIVSNFGLDFYSNNIEPDYTRF
jgi:hypothetical protein